jgi:hypothetical protein
MIWREQLDARLIDGPGQPVEGAITARSIDWKDIALDDKESFRSGLRNLGLPDGLVADGMSFLGDVSRDLLGVDKEISDFRDRTKGASFFVTPPELLALYEKKRSIRRRLNDWLAARTIRVERTEELLLRIPVFILSAPDVESCSASFTTATELARNLSCEIKILGSGIAGGSEVTCQAQCEFTVNSGKAKVVFISAELTVGEVQVLEKGLAVGQGNNILAIEFPNPEPAVAVVPDDVNLTPGELKRIYLLEGDTTGDISTYHYEYRQIRPAAFSLGGQAFGANLGLTVDVSIQQWVALSYALKGGYKYSCYGLERGQGIVWSVSS